MTQMTAALLKQYLDVRAYCNDAQGLAILVKDICQAKDDVRDELVDAIAMAEEIEQILLPPDPKRKTRSDKGTTRKSKPKGVEGNAAVA